MHVIDQKLWFGRIWGYRFESTISHFICTYNQILIGFSSIVQVPNMAISLLIADFVITRY